jgi:cell division protein FtsB
VIPAIAAVAIAYFGYYTIWGTRGLLALYDTNARLSVQQEQLATLKDSRERLQRRIDLLRKGDRDMVEETAREEMLDSVPGQVAVPREKH